MTVMNKVWPSSREATKEEAERMYKVAYYIDPKFLKPADVVDYGLDLPYLKEFGEVRFKKDWNKVRPHVQKLWERLNGAQRAMFLYSYLWQGLEHIRGILKDLEPYVGNVSSENVSIDQVTTILFPKFPKELQRKIQDGFGKEWSR
jgi:hypothetical protein